MDYYTKGYGDYLDLHDGTILVDDPNELSTDLHAAFLFQTKVEQVIAGHASNYPDTPMFLYYALQLMHFPLTVPNRFKERCVGAVDVYTEAEVYCGMSLMLDEVIANLTCALRVNGMTDNTILVITSDNGGEQAVAADSYPFRGHKYDYFRGGLSANGFISASSTDIIPSAARGSFYNGQMHITGSYSRMSMYVLYVCIQIYVFVPTVCRLKCMYVRTYVFGDLLIFLKPNIFSSVRDSSILTLAIFFCVTAVVALCLAAYSQTGFQH